MNNRGCTPCNWRWYQKVVIILDSSDMSCGLRPRRLALSLISMSRQAFQRANVNKQMVEICWKLFLKQSRGACFRSYGWKNSNFNNKYAGFNFINYSSWNKQSYDKTMSVATLRTDQICQHQEFCSRSWTFCNIGESSLFEEDECYST